MNTLGEQTKFIPRTCEHLRTFVARINNVSGNLSSHADRVSGPRPESSGQPSGAETPAFSAIGEMETVLTILENAISDLEAQAARNVDMA